VQLVERERVVDPHDGVAAERGHAPARHRSIVSAWWASGESSTWPGWASATMRAARLTGRAGDLAVADLDIAVVDRQAQRRVGAESGERGRCLDRDRHVREGDEDGRATEADDLVASRSTNGASTSSRRVERGSASFGAPTLRIQFGDQDGAPFDPWSGLQLEGLVLDQDPALQLLQLR
jgi:hypothetical protein